jgi:hypothetical protein
VRIPEILRWSEGVSSPSRLLYVPLAILIFITRIVTGTGVLHMALFVVLSVEHGGVWFCLGDEILTEFCAPLVN